MQTQEEAFAAEVVAEVLRARAKFPQPNPTFAAMVEESGEVATALLDVQWGKDTREHLREECVQLAAMACRIALEGDPGFPKSQP